MAGFISDKPVEEEQVRTKKDDSSVKNVEEQRVRTEEDAPAKTTEEEGDVRTDKDDSVKKVEEERVRTEEADRAKTTDEEGVRTDEDAPREEAIESLLDSAPNLEQESDERNENPHEDSTMIPRSDQPTNRGSTSFLTELNLLRALENRPISPQTTNRGSTSFLTDQYRLNHPINHQTRSRVTELPLQNPRSDQMMIPSVQNNVKQPFGVKPLPPGWFVSDHIFEAGFNPNDAAWRPQVIRPLMPNQTTSSDQQHPMANQLADIAGLQNQMFVPKPLFFASRIYSVPPQPHLHVMASSTCRYYPLMGTEANQLNLMWPHFRDDQMFTLTSPSGQPRRFLVVPYHPSYPERKCVYSLDDAVVFAPPLELNPVGPWPELNHQQMQPHRFYQGPHLFFPVDMFYHPAYSNAAAPRPAESNHQQGQQHEPQTQDQSQRFDAGGSSRQGQDQQQP